MERHKDKRKANNEEKEDPKKKAWRKLLLY